MNKKRPVNLDLTTIQLPVTAKASILHRVSGIFLFLCLPCLLYVLQQSLHSADSFEAIRNSLNSGITRVVLSLAVMAVVYHLIAGIRHLIMDMGHGETLEGGQLGARIVLFGGIAAAVLAGVWVW